MKSVRHLVCFLFPVILALMAAICLARVAPSVQPGSARVNLVGSANGSEVIGVLSLKETATQQVIVAGLISGLKPGKHGVHIHQWGDVFTDGCESTGPHFNPNKVRVANLVCYSRLDIKSCHTLDTCKCFMP